MYDPSDELAYDPSYDLVYVSPIHAVLLYRSIALLLYCSSRFVNVSHSSNIQSVERLERLV